MPHVHGEDRSARPLNTFDNLCLHAERAHEPIQIGDDDNVSLPVLDELDGVAESWTLSEGSSARYVELFEHLDELEAVALAGCTDAVALLSRRYEALAVAVADVRDANDS